METFLTRAITLVALICFLVVGVAATSILGRDSVPVPRDQAVASESGFSAPVSNKEGKKDRLAVASFALAAYEPPQAQAMPSPAQAQLRPKRRRRSGPYRVAAPGLRLDRADRYRHAAIE